MPEIKDADKPNKFEPVYLIIKTRKEFDYLHGLVGARCGMRKQDCNGFDTNIDTNFSICLNSYHNAHLK